MFLWSHESTIMQLAHNHGNPWRRGRHCPEMGGLGDKRTPSTFTSGGGEVAAHGSQWIVYIIIRPVCLNNGEYENVNHCDV